MVTLIVGIILYFWIGTGLYLLLMMAARCEDQLNKAVGKERRSVEELVKRQKGFFILVWFLALMLVPIHRLIEQKREAAEEKEQC